MARPAKAMAVNKSAMTNETSKARLDIEKVLKCGDSALEAPEELTPGQKKVYDYIKANMEAIGMLGEMHSFALVRLAVTIDRLNRLEQDARKRPDLIYDKDFLAAQREYSRQFEKLCAEFCLTPHAMAQMSISLLKNQKKEEKKTLASILVDD